MILIDPPAVPHYGRLWSHLASDTSYDELHEFAAALGLPPRGFDRDHYDVPDEHYDAMVAAGAREVSSRGAGHRPASRRVASSEGPGLSRASSAPAFARAAASQCSRAYAVWNSVSFASRSSRMAARPAAKSSSETCAYSWRTVATYSCVALGRCGQDRQVGVGERAPVGVVRLRAVCGGEPHEPADLGGVDLARQRALGPPGRQLLVVSGPGVHRVVEPRSQQHRLAGEADTRVGELVEPLENLGQVAQVVVAAGRIGVRRYQLVAEVVVPGQGPPPGKVAHARHSTG